MGRIPSLTTMASADRLIDIFHEAKARSAGNARDGFLAEACGDDVELKLQMVCVRGRSRGRI